MATSITFWVVRDALANHCLPQPCNVISRERKSCLKGSKSWHWRKNGWSVRFCISVWTKAVLMPNRYRIIWMILCLNMKIYMADVLLRPRSTTGLMVSYKGHTSSRVYRLPSWWTSMMHLCNIPSILLIMTNAVVCIVTSSLGSRTMAIVSSVCSSQALRSSLKSVCSVCLTRWPISVSTMIMLLFADWLRMKSSRVLAKSCTNLPIRKAGIWKKLFQDWRICMTAIISPKVCKVFTILSACYAPWTNCAWSRSG